jgi:hypothetical protein
MKYLIILVIISITYSCKNSIIKSKLSGSDSLVITFNEPNSDIITKTVSTEEITAIKKFIRFVNKKETEKFKCGYDGNMIFFRDGKEQLPIVFKYKEKDCQHFLFEIDGKILSTKMNQECADLLESLEEGKTWY